jgi:hypothetical protein
MLKNDLIIGLANNKNILKQFISSLKEDEIQRRIRDYWTIYEHVDHLVLTQKILLGRIQQFIVENQPVIMKPYTPDEKVKVEDVNKSTKNLVNEFCKLRDIQIGLIRKAKRNVWSKEGKHEEYSKYSFEILLRHILLHDSFHMARIEELWIKKEQFIMELNQS